ncbi:MAG TPA: phosphotransferase, partial [Gemmatimonadales bacterium]
MLRVAKHAGAAAALVRECRLLPRLASTLPLAVPEPEFCFAGEGDDPAFALHRELPGPALTRERYLALPEPARERCAGAVGRFLARLHATDLALARACGVPEVDYGRRAAELLERAREGLWPRLAEEDRRWVERRLTVFPGGDPARVPRVLLHGDLSPDHILYDEAAARVTGVIDFGDLAAGDPAWDLVYLYEDYGEDFLERAMRAYPAEGDPGWRVRMRWHLAVDAVRWAVECVETGDEEG